MPYIGKSPTPVPLSASDLNDDIISLAKMAGGTDGNLITYDASGNPVAVATGDDGQVLTSAGAGNPCLFEAAAGGGKIGQVVQTVHTGTETLASTTPTTIPNFTVSITPAATSSKILVMTNALIGVDNNYTCGFSLYRDTTEIYIGNTAGSRDRLSWSSHQYGTGRLMFTAAISYLDSPSSTSALDYSLKWLSQAGTNMYLNRTYDDGNEVDYDNRAASSITVMEVLA